MVLNWERARSEEQIEHRIGEIVEATSRLYERHRVDDITFALIAKEAGFTRSNLYRYFDTKEEVFLEFIKHDITRWREEVFQCFAGGSGSIAQFSATWVDLQLKHHRMIKLLTILSTVLEPNSSLEALTNFKRKLVEEIDLLTGLLTDVLPFPSGESAAEFVFAQTSLAIGMYPTLDPTPNQQEAMNQVGMVSDQEYYRTMLVNSTESLLRGLTDT